MQNINVSVTMELHEPFDHITEFNEEERCSVIKPKTLIYLKNIYRCLLIKFASVVSKLLPSSAMPQRNKTSHFLEPMTLVTWCKMIPFLWFSMIVITGRDLAPLIFLKKLPDCKPYKLFTAMQTLSRLPADITNRSHNAELLH